MLQEMVEHWCNLKENRSNSSLKIKRLHYICTSTHLRETELVLNELGREQKFLEAIPLFAVSWVRGKLMRPLSSQAT